NESLNAEIRQGDSMSTKRKHHSAEQIVKKLRDAETMLHAGKTVAEVVQTHVVNEQALLPLEDQVRRSLESQI
ncbi:MAG: hypothetical protein P8J37_06510, partial [Fuerstiella sp.]|nr:hypothetical protein [Fuerstiella sp.]